MGKKSLLAFQKQLMLKTNHSSIQTVRCLWIWNNSVTLMILTEMITLGRFPRSKLHRTALLPSSPWPVGRRLSDSEIAHNLQGGKMGQFDPVFRDRNVIFFSRTKMSVERFWESVSAGAWPHPVSGPVPPLSKEPPPRSSAGPGVSGSGKSMAPLSITSGKIQLYVFLLCSKFPWNTVRILGNSQSGMLHSYLKTKRRWGDSPSYSGWECGPGSARSPCLPSYLWASSLPVYSGSSCWRTASRI